MDDYPGDNWHPAKDLFLAEITAVGTAVTDSSGRFVPHAWKEKELRTDTRGFVDKPGGRTGTTVIHPGFDPTGGTFAVGDLVFMRERGWINASGVSGDVYDIVCAAGVRGDECCPGYLGDTGHESCCDFLGKPGGDCCCDCPPPPGPGPVPGPGPGGTPGCWDCIGNASGSGPPYVWQLWNGSNAYYSHIGYGYPCNPNDPTDPPPPPTGHDLCSGGPAPLPGPGGGGGGGVPPPGCPPGWIPGPNGGCCDKPWVLQNGYWHCPSDTEVGVGGWVGGGRGQGGGGGLIQRSAVFGRGSLGRDALGGSVLDESGVTTTPPTGGAMPSNTVTPADLTADQNNYAPGSCGQLSLNTDGLGNRRITGLNIGQVTGQRLIIENRASVDSIILDVEDAASTAAYRFLNQQANDITDITIGPQNMVEFIYMGSRWRRIE